MGCAWVEFDVRLTADGALVICHDDRLERTTNGRGRVLKLPLVAIRELDAGRWFGERFAGERVPTLDELLALCRELRLGANVEIKAERGQARATAAAVTTCFERLSGSLPPILVSSFIPEAVGEMAERAPSFARGMLFRKVPGNWRKIFRAAKCCRWSRAARASPCRTAKAPAPGPRPAASARSPASTPTASTSGGKPIPQIYHGRTRRERHEELIAYAIAGGIPGARRLRALGRQRPHPHERAVGDGRRRAHAARRAGRRAGLIHGVTCGAGMPYRIAEIARATASTTTRSSPRPAPSARCGSAPTTSSATGWAAWSTRTRGSPAAITASPTARTRRARGSATRACASCAA
jgi:hypothetical protein